jgi:hypothetical protein
MMHFKPLIATASLGAAALAALLCTGCGSAKKPPDANPPTVKTAAPPKQATACEMVTQAEMAAILGVAVTATDTTHSGGGTACTYAAASGFPAVQIEVNRGDGEAAMSGFNMLNRSEPGIGSPYEGIGDQAVAVGPTLMIKTGDDLMQLLFNGVDDAPAAAKKIFLTAKPRMSP